MAINDAAPRAPRGLWRALAGLFDEAWKHGRNRQFRALLMLLLVMAGTATTLILAMSGGTDRSAVTASGPTAAGPYQVCAANISGLWRYTYGTDSCTAMANSSGKPYSYGNLMLPARATVDLTIARAQSLHSLRIAALGIKIRASVSSTEKVTFRVPHATKIYSGQCLTGCLHDRAFARTNVVVITPADYTRWVAGRQSEITKETRQLGQLRKTLKREGVLARNSSS